MACDELKRSEARVIIYLNNASMQHRYALKIAIKLKMDYNYLLRLLAGMKERSWINYERKDTRKFYYLTHAPIEKAKKVMLK